ncbi:cobalamin biosynthesis protein [Celeribacter halophilus]|uniref:cobalamin biosynthesis protein n=1 Tax=Celeribacter halophilus TaxID=576117 RepID=UPI001C08C3B8|nr:cobalamin biosynthesis protein [Celeribacter halophilus]MBU2890711.1 cobalamin biosynthesis protein [Celeribacter halophilus]MDO6510124.1 cobalamin biosynthesis protein [Celeribacter halophilus]
MRDTGRSASERPAGVIAGFGFRTGASVQSFEDALAQAAQGREVTAIATLSDKAATPAFAAFLRATGLPLYCVSQEQVQRMGTATQSTASQAARQTGSVAEAVALAAAGRGARLLGARVVSQDRRATCALAVIEASETCAPDKTTSDTTIPDKKTSNAFNQGEIS